MKIKLVILIFILFLFHKTSPAFAAITIKATADGGKTFNNISFRCMDYPPKSGNLPVPPKSANFITGAGGSFTWPINGESGHKYSCYSQSMPDCYYPLPSSQQTTSSIILNPGENKTLNFIFKYSADSCQKTIPSHLPCTQQKPVDYVARDCSVDKNMLDACLKNFCIEKVDPCYTDDQQKQICDKLGYSEVKPSVTSFQNPSQTVSTNPLPTVPSPTENINKPSISNIISQIFNRLFGWIFSKK